MDGADWFAPIDVRHNESFRTSSPSGDNVTVTVDWADHYAIQLFGNPEYLKFYDDKIREWNPNASTYAGTIDSCGWPDDPQGQPAWNKVLLDAACCCHSLEQCLVSVRQSVTNTMLLFAAAHSSAPSVSMRTLARAGMTHASRLRLSSLAARRTHSGASHRLPCCIEATLAHSHRTTPTGFRHQTTLGTQQIRTDPTRLSRTRVP